MPFTNKKPDLYLCKSDFFITLMVNDFFYIMTYKAAFSSIMHYECHFASSMVPSI